VRYVTLSAYAWNDIDSLNQGARLYCDYVLGRYQRDKCPDVDVVVYSVTDSSIYCREVSGHPSYIVASCNAARRSSAVLSRFEL
jgi:hypothetical protein